jgi:predicted TIM-barrel fold metal-dependent hydrolase
MRGSRTRVTSTPSGVTPPEEEFPPMISVDDHVFEPRDVWQRELPAKWRDRGPKVVRQRATLGFSGGRQTFELDVEDGEWCDVWYFDDLVLPTTLLNGPAGLPPSEQEHRPAVYEDFRPGTWNQADRLADMDLNHVEAALNYPNTFPRFAGQGFAERSDKELAFACLQIYNDWMIDEWCGGAGRGRLIPLTLVPLWDAELAAKEVRRCAAKGSHAIAFSENPSKLGFASLYSGDWDPLWAACEETETTVSMHIGSSSSMPTTSPDAPMAVSMSLNSQNAQGSLCDWVFSKSLIRFPRLKLAYSESQVGWMPFQLERMDAVWYEDVGGVDLDDPPSTYVRGRVYGCIFDDLHGLRCRDEVGMDMILFEADYPHANGTWPHTRKIAHELCSAAGMEADEVYRLLRGNAIACYGLERFGIAA